VHGELLIAGRVVDVRVANREDQMIELKLMFVAALLPFAACLAEAPPADETETTAVERTTAEVEQPGPELDTLALGVCERDCGWIHDADVQYCRTLFGTLRLVCLRQANADYAVCLSLCP
jgi:hypothetical protein